jgi:hypothetical protein
MRPDPKDDEEEMNQAMEIWQSEAHDLFRAAREALGRVDRLLGVGVTLIAAATITGLANNFPDVMLIVPSALLLLLTYVTQVYCDAIVLRAGRRQIEKVLGDQFGHEVLIYETHLAKYRDARMDPSINLAAVAYGVFAAIAVVGGTYVAFWQHHSGLVRAAFVLSTLVSTIAAVSVGAYIRTLEERVSESIKDWNRRDIS